MNIKHPVSYTDSSTPEYTALLSNKRIAIVCDWLKDWGGAEQVLFDLLEIFPHADIYSSIFFEKNFPSLVGKVKTTFIDTIPVLRGKPKMVPFLRTYAFEGLDLSGYDIVISSASAESKGIITRPETIHFCYCHTPTRYYWSHTHEYLENPEFGWLNPIAKLFMPIIFHKMRIWDFIAAQRVHYFIANSKTTAKRIERYYRREAETIAPGIDETLYFPPVSETQECFKKSIGECVGSTCDGSLILQEALRTQKYFITVCRVIPYKRIDILIDAFNQSGETLVICTNIQSGYQKGLQEKSQKNIIWVFAPNQAIKITLMQHALGFLFPGEEDYGLTPIESMLCGTPIIAFGKGGALETVCAGKSGIFFNEQTPASVLKGMIEFKRKKWNRNQVREAALHLSKRNFRKAIIEFISSKLH